VKQASVKRGFTLGRVTENVKVQSPTGDMLVNPLPTGSLDAAALVVRLIVRLFGMGKTAW
jgi:hypothetical protein